VRADYGNNSGGDLVNIAPGENIETDGGLPPMTGGAVATGRTNEHSLVEKERTVNVQVAVVLNVAKLSELTSSRN